jgi:hypothetical protein
MQAKMNLSLYSIWEQLLSSMTAYHRSCSSYEVSMVRVLEKCKQVIISVYCHSVSYVKDSFHVNIGFGHVCFQLQIVLDELG